MFERLSDLYGRVQESRLRLEDLAEQAARLRGRLREDTALVDSLERLSNATSDLAAAAVNEADSADARLSAHVEGDHLMSDAWEIALISEEGK